MPIYATPNPPSTESVKPSAGHVDDQVVSDVDLDPLIEALTARITGRDGAAQEVRAVVEEIARGFDNATVRDFLSVLILKQATDRLRDSGLLDTVTS